MIMEVHKCTFNMNIPPEEDPLHVLYETEAAVAHQSQ